MTSNYPQWEQNLARVARDIPTKKIQLLATKVAYTALTGIVTRNPVGNPDAWASVVAGGTPPSGYVGGQSRGNWFVDVGNINSRVDPGVDASGSKTIGRGTTVIAAAAPYSKIFIHNSVPQIMPLESGNHSKQAPAGMVGVTVQEINVHFSGIQI